MHLWVNLVMIAEIAQAVPQPGGREIDEAVTKTKGPAMRGASLGYHLLVEDQCSLLSVLLRRSIRSARARKYTASFMHASLTSLVELWRATKRQSSASSR